MDIKGYIKKRKIVDKPVCKYGLSCYQKNPEHRKKFKHPTENETKIDDNQVTCLNEAKKTSEKTECFLKKANVTQLSISEDAHLNDADESSSSESTDDSTEETVGEILKLMPKDFFEFWKFSGCISKLKPEDAFAEFGYHLVGVFDLLAKKLPKDMKVDISCHWRYYFDPPEFQTVIKKDGSDWYHIGYFRDDPLKKPSILASNSAAKDAKLTLVGDNIFCAMNAELNKVIRLLNSKVSKDRAIKLQNDLKKFASAKDYELNITTDKTKRRQKRVVAKTFNGLGIVVPVKNDVGYRPLTDSNAALRNILERIVSAKTKAKQLTEQEALNEIISNVHFANDECDYGMGLELGIDLFCNGDPFFHQYIMRVLSLAYDLLNRSKYAAIVRTHLKNRTKGEMLSTLNI